MTLSVVGRFAAASMSIFHQITRARFGESETGGPYKKMRNANEARGQRKMSDFDLNVMANIAYFVLLLSFLMRDILAAYVPAMSIIMPY